MVGERRAVDAQRQGGHATNVRVTTFSIQPSRTSPPRHWLSTGTCSRTSASRSQRAARRRDAAGTRFAHQSASNGTIAVKITAMSPSLPSPSAVRQLMFNLPSMAPSIRLQWHHQTAVILIGCAPTHLHPAFNGTINPPAMAPLLSKLQQCHHAAINPQNTTQHPPQNISLTYSKNAPIPLPYGKPWKSHSHT